jgi:ribose-phosphate pyrophosphokinase
MRLFALNGSEHLGESVARAAGTELDAHEERHFEDGEHKARPLVSVRGEDVYVVHSLRGGPGASANDKLVTLLFFVAACKENGAQRVTVVAPYLCYSRKDRQTKSRDPVSTRYVAQLFEAMGTDRLVTLDVHNLAAFQNAFRCQTVHLDTRRMFVEAITARAEGVPISVVAPDGGAVKRAQLLREAFETMTGGEAGFGFMEKRRSAGVVSGELFAGDVAGRKVFVIDDMIATGGTMLRAAETCMANGAHSVYVLATHGLFAEGYEALVRDPAITGTVVTDTVVNALEAAGDPANRIAVLPVSGLLGEALLRLNRGGSIRRLLEPER